MNAEHLLMAAKMFGETRSNCRRRQIGAVILRDRSEVNSPFYRGANHTYHDCTICTRETGECPAIHAEVTAIIAADVNAWQADDLFVFSEVPCKACLNFIRSQSAIKNVYCVAIESYRNYYPTAAGYEQRVLDRLILADKIGLTIHQLTIQNLKPN